MNKRTQPVIIVDEETLTLEEISHTIQVGDDLIVEMVELRLITPTGNSKADWRFDSRSLKRAKLAASFYRDLEINLNGASLALDLIDKIHLLENELKKYHR